MKRIYIVRHAKSSWRDMSLADVDRPLNKRGKRDAPRMAEICLSKAYVPQRIISSNANRAANTAKVFLKTMGIGVDNFSIDNSLYHAPEDSYLTACYGLEDDIDSVMLFGHNPGITYLANSVSKEYIDNVPTCGVLVINANVDNWTDLDFSKCSLVDFLYPKMF